MSIDYQKLRLDGIYQQNNDGDLMLRVKIPAGVLSSEQAEKICDISERFSNGVLHLTSRGSIEFHWLQYADLPQVLAMLSAVGLTSRGACGGAVRGISCSTGFSTGFGTVQTLARQLHRHFAGNPHFEGLPKKFKIGVDAGYEGARHLIQDLGLVFTGHSDGEDRYDVWVGGGLGREPQAAILYERAVGVSGLIPLIEAVVRVYARNTPPPKRLKFLLNQIGEQEFRTKVEASRRHGTPPELRPSLDGPLTLADTAPFEVPVFAGELASSGLRTVAGLAGDYGNGYLALSADQNLLLPLPQDADRAGLTSALQAAGLIANTPENRLCFRVCPGNHECRMGLAATRDIAAAICQALADKPAPDSLAISGCPNACSQPQLASLGIITRKALKQEDGSRQPRFDLTRRYGDGLGEIIASDLDQAALASQT